MINQTRAGQKRIAWSLVACMLLETLVFPSTALALTSGPKQPEFEKFTPVATTNMVNPNTGNFQYNLPVLSIPGADGGGYALSLSYNADPGVESEASWVGHNWTLNPGALNRAKRGLPDDYKGQVEEYNMLKPTFSFSRTRGFSVGVVGGSQLTGGGSFQYNTTHSWNNISGYGSSTSIGVSGSLSQETGVSGSLGMSLDISGSDVVFSANLSIGATIESKIKELKDKTKQNVEGWLKKQGLNLVNNLVSSARLSIGTGGQFGLIGHVNSSVASVVKPSRSMSYTFGVTGIGYAGPVTTKGPVSEKTTLQVAQPIVNYEAYGYMYNPDKNKHLYHQNQGEHVMSDYGIEKNSNYSARDNISGIVYNNADNFNAIGEGISGSYRLQHNNVGHYYADWTADEQNRNVSLISDVEGGFGVKFDSSGNVGVAVSVGASMQFENKGKTEAKRWLLWDNSENLATNVDNYEFDQQTLPKFRVRNDLGGGLLFVNPDELDELVKEYRGGFFGTVRRSDGQGGKVIDGVVRGNRPSISHFISQNKYVGEDYYKGQSSYMEYVRNIDLKCASCSPGLSTIDRSKALDKHQRALKYLDNGTVATPGASLQEGNRSVEASQLEEHIAQIKVWNPDGTRYTYGLPVYVRNEANFSYGVDASKANQVAQLPGKFGNGERVKLQGNHLIYPDVNVGFGERNLTVKQGQELKEWYANTYLMTQITTPDYIDLTGNGASEDDFGGYTRFDYRRWYKRDNPTGNADLNNWYRYRAPYTGLRYNPGELAKQSDDMGTVSHGFREMYYLNAVETKSHVAIFITNKTKANRDFGHLGISDAAYDGSGEIRLDGLGQVLETLMDEPREMDGTLAQVHTDAPNYSNQTAGSNGTKNSEAINSPNAKDKSQDVEKLERIVLFAKSDLSKPLMTTNLEYDYSAWSGVHNNVNTNALNTAIGHQETGKLTLKKVWFEYEGVKRHRVSPYEFEYEYAKVSDFAPEVVNRYPAIFDPAQGGDWPNADAGTTGQSLVEHPNYNPHATDRWGNWAYDGADRRKNYQHWLYQGNYDPAQGYDPAAWMLKQIKLPSGGSIHVQYEEKTYQKVQDRQANAMVSLLGDFSVDDQTDGTSNKYYLNLEDLGIDPSNQAEKEALADLIVAEYTSANANTSVNGSTVLTANDFNEHDEKNRIYFKFLYQLEDGSSSEYISGYALVNTIGMDVNGIYLSLGNVKNRALFANRQDIPRKLCYDHVQYKNHKNYEFEYFNNASDVTTTSNNMVGDYQAFAQEVEQGGNPSSRLGNHVDDDAFSAMKSNFIGEETPIYASGSTCKNISYKYSYIRVPMPKAKRGGGVRVKRVLMYDEGLETGDAQLFGMDYDYVKEDGTCSGVATNEPNEGREENALVGYEKRKPQDSFTKLFAGKDRKEGEVPYGEFLLPPASITYGRVVTSNIYKGNQQNDGFKVQEFYTMEDYPSLMRFDDPKFGILEGLTSLQYTKLGTGKPTDEDKRRNYRRSSFVPVNLGLFNYNQHYRWTSQSFMFIQTDMNGKTKSEQTYSGVYNRAYFQDPSANSAFGITLTSKVTYDYIQPGEKAKVLTFDKATGKYNMEEHHLGIEDEVTMTAQTTYQTSNQVGANVSFLITFFGAAAKVQPNLGLNFNFSEQGMSRHLTTRTLYFPSVLKSVTTQMNNSTTTVEHLAFSDLTGQPILTKTTDGFDRSVVVDAQGNKVVHDGSIYNWNLPAAWFYDGMGKKSIDPAHTNQLMAAVGSVTSYGENGNPLPASPGEMTWTNNPEGILNASAATLKNTGWFSGINDPILQDYKVDPTQNLPADIITQLEQQYRVHETFVYDPNETSSSANDDGTDNWGQGNKKVYKSGVFDNFTFFDWLNPANNTNWTAVSEVTKYTPNGYAVEQVSSITDIPSAAKYGYSKFLSTAVAQNATYNSIGFESFEDEQFENDNELRSISHAGQYGLELTATPKSIFSNLEITDRVQHAQLGGGLLLRLWAKNTLVNNTENKVNFGQGSNHIKAELVGATTFGASNETVIAQVGEWVLLEYRFDFGNPSNPTTYPNNFALELSVDGLAADQTPLTSLMIDDVRIQPVQAEMTTYVYDNKTFKPIAQFGAQHFGTFYQYNDEGQLIRTMVETEQGLKTVQEQQTHVPRHHSVN